MITGPASSRASGGAGLSVLCARVQVCITACTRRAVPARFPLRPVARGRAAGALRAGGDERAEWATRLYAMGLTCGWHESRTGRAARYSRYQSHGAMGVEQGCTEQARYAMHEGCLPRLH